ncbi:hypothetical protein KI387_041159, partial [Taxus chinensis]
GLRMVNSATSVPFSVGSQGGDGLCGWRLQNARRRIIFRAEAEAVCKAISRVLGEEHLGDSQRARVNSEVASWFVSRLLLVRQNVEEVRVIALFYIESQHRLNLVKALEEYGRGCPLPAVVREGLALAEAKLVIVELSARNSMLMHFASDVHSACVEGLGEGHHLEKLDLPGLSAPVVPNSAGVVSLRRQLGSTFRLPVA